MRKSIIFIFFFLLSNLLFLSGPPSSSLNLAPQEATTPIQEQWYNQGIIHFYGTESLFELNLSINYFFNDTYTKVEDQIFFILNRVGSTYNLTMTGCYLSDIFQKTDFLTENATHIQFEARDGYRTFPLPLRLLRIHPDMAFVITHEDGELIPAYPEEGPLKSAVKLEAIQEDPEMQAIFQQNCAPGEDFVHNSKFLVKNLCAINVFRHSPYNLTTTDTDNITTSTSLRPDPSMYIDGFQMEYLLNSIGIFVLLYRSIIKKKRSDEDGKFSD